MLLRFATWDGVVQYVRSHRTLYLVPNDSWGPIPLAARLPLTGDGAHIHLRDPGQYIPSGYPPMVADQTFLGKLYRWEVNKSDPT